MGAGTHHDVQQMLSIALVNETRRLQRLDGEFVMAEQNVPVGPIPHDIPQHAGPISTQSPALTDLPVIAPPVTAISPSVSAPIAGLSSQGLPGSKSIPGVITSPPSDTITASPSKILTSTNAPSSASLATSTAIATSAVIATSTVIASSSAALSSSAASTSIAAHSTVIVTSWTSVQSVMSTFTSSSASIISSSVVLTTATAIPQSISRILSSTFTSASETSTETMTSTTEVPFSETSTFLPSSTLSGSDFTGIASITMNDTAPMSTVSATPAPINTANVRTHGALFYLGIVLGIIAGIAILSALTASAVRLRSRARRRRAAKTHVPWARPDPGDDGNLEAGHGIGSDANNAAGALRLGSREELAHVQAWSPRGDRDVGEPRRTESYINASSYSLQNHHIPEFGLFSDDSVRALAYDGYTASSLRPHRTLRQLPSHLVDQDLLARADQGNPSLRSGYSGQHTGLASRDHLLSTGYGTPRGSIDRPRFLGLTGDGLSIPWKQDIAATAATPSHSKMTERLRNLGKPPTEPAWGRISPHPESGDMNVGNAEVEPWSATFRSSLVNAFNAVAANISSSVAVPNMTEDDKLTPAPPKHTMVRQSVRDTSWDQNISKMKELSRGSSLLSMSSKPWTLEETREGAGVVHLFIPGLEGEDDPMAPRSTMGDSTLSFGDGNGITHNDYNPDCRSVQNRESRIPLFASKKPPPAFTRPDAHLRRRITGETLNDGARTRDGSSYDASLMYTEAQNRVGAPRLPPMPSRTSAFTISSITGRGALENPASDTVIIEPEQISRLSSYNSSMVSSGTDQLAKPSPTRDDLDVASRALKTRWG